MSRWYVAVCLPCPWCSTLPLLCTHQPWHWSRWWVSMLTCHVPLSLWFVSFTPQWVGWRSNINNIDANCNWHKTLKYFRQWCGQMCSSCSSCSWPSSSLWHCQQLRRVEWDTCLTRVIRMDVSRCSTWLWILERDTLCGELCLVTLSCGSACLVSAKLRFKGRRNNLNNNGVCVKIVIKFLALQILQSYPL